MVNKKFNFFKNNLCFYSLSSHLQIQVYGNNASKLINNFSIRDINLINENSFYTIMMNKKIFIDEVIIIKQADYKYLIITKAKKLFKYLIKSIYNFKLTTVNLINDYNIYSLHGNFAFLNNHSSKLFCVNRQGYKHYIYLSLKNGFYSTPNFFKNFYELSVDNYRLFLYNNNVICNFNIKNKRLKLNLIKMIYNADNTNFYVKPVFLEIKKYESSLNFIPSKGSKILNSSYKKIGLIHHYFRLPNKKNPYIIAIIYKYRFQKKAFIKDKYTNNFVIIKYKPLFR